MPVMKIEQSQKVIKADSTPKMKPKQIAALLATGYRLYQQGRLKDAKSIFEGLIVLDDSIAYSYGIVAAIDQKQGNYVESIARYDAALKLNPRDISSLTNRGEVHLRLGHFQQAAEDLKKAIEMDPTRKLPAANRARLLVSLVQDALQLAKQKGTAAVEDMRKKAETNAKPSMPLIIRR